MFSWIITIATKKIDRYLLLLAFTVCSFPALAQVPTKFEHLITENGLSNNFVNTIYQDSEGFLWFGTFAGLDRYDGYNFEIFYNDASDSRSLSHSSVYSMLEDKSGHLWIGTERGLNRYDKESNTFQSFRANPKNPDGLSNDNIRSIYQDRNGNLWLGTYGGGINMFNTATGKFKRYVNIPGDNSSIINNHVNCLFVDKENNFWVGTEGGGFSLFNPATGKFTNYHASYSKSELLKNDIVTQIIDDELGNIWFGTWYEGFFTYDKDSKKFTNYRKGKINENNPPENTVLSILRDNQGFLWIGTFGGGLEKFNPSNGAMVHYKNDPDNPNSLSHDAVWSIYQDKSGIIWIGTFGGGINIYDPSSNRFTLYKASRLRPNSLSNNSVTSIMEDHSGALWIGTAGGGINILNPKKNTFTYKFNEPNTAQSVIRAIREDSNHNIWVSTDDGIYEIDKSGQKTTRFPKNGNPEGFGNNYNYSICEDRSGDLWFSTWNEGLQCLSLKDITKFQPKDVKLKTFKHLEGNPNSLPDNVVWEVIQDKKGELWIATSSCVARYSKKNNQFTSYLRNDRSKKDEKYNVSCVFEDRRNNIWFGTFGYGFGKIDKENNTYTLYNPQSGYNVAEIIAIEEDDKNNLWMSTNKGIIKFNPDLNKIWSYDVTDGLQGDLFHMGANVRLRSGEIAFGGVHGFNIFYPDSISDIQYIPPVYITDIKVYGKSLFKDKSEKHKLQTQLSYRTKEIKIPYSQKIITIEFTALTYSSPEKNQFSYQLDGFDKSWISTTGKNRTATYTNLKGGDYIFRVKACNKDGVWNETGATLKITIIPPFWQQLWFRFILVFAIVGMIFLLFRFRLNRIHKRLEEINISKEKELVKLRNEKLNTELDFKTKELARSTMHVIRKNEEIIEIRNMLEEIVPVTGSEGKQKLTRLLKSIDQKLDNSSSWDYFEYNFNLVHNNFLKRFAETYPDINQNDLKICAYIRMNLSTKEIANLLNISYRTIESTRYRIRKKINLESDKTLNDYIMRF